MHVRGVPSMHNVPILTHYVVPALLEQFGRLGHLAKNTAIHAKHANRVSPKARANKQTNKQTNKPAFVAQSRALGKAAKCNKEMVSHASRTKPKKIFTTGGALAEAKRTKG